MRPFLLCVLLCAPLPALALDADSETRRLDALTDRFYDRLLAINPVRATELGVHTHDAELDDRTPAAIAAEIAFLHATDAELADLHVALLAPARAIDWEVVRRGVRCRLVELERVQPWRHRPDDYLDLVTNAVYLLMIRDFAPVETRLQSAIARELKIPALLAQSRRNLIKMPRVAVEIALEQLPGTVDFFVKDVPSAFPVADTALLARFRQSNDAVLRALRDWGTWLKRELPRARGDFALGEATFRAKLAADELVDTPLDELLARGEAELQHLQAQFKATAARIDPSKSPAEVQADVQKLHPAASALIADTQSRLAGLRQFLVDKKIVSLPSDHLPRVQETPPFMRATTIASMETPGPFEPRATEAYFNVTLPDPSWKEAQVEDYLRGAFAQPTIVSTSIHEAFPGHYVQFIWVPRVASRARKMEHVDSNVEGWAHYCEQMMLDEGWGEGDLKLRLGQLQDALLRAARYVVGIRMHTRGMTLDQAVEFFQKQGLQSQKVAEIEARRGTGDPTYLYYTLGKLEILSLRDDYKKKLGAAYTLQKFHDALLAEGPIPLPLLRHALLR